MLEDPKSLNRSLFVRVLWGKNSSLQETSLIESWVMYYYSQGIWPQYDLSCVITHRVSDFNIQEEEPAGLLLVSLVCLHSSQWCLQYVLAVGSDQVRAGNRVSSVL